MVISEVPLWDDCPFRHRVPDWIEIRRGDVFGQTVTVFYAPKHELSLDFTGPIEHTLGPALGNLGLAAFEQEHPGEFMKLIREQAHAAVGGQSLPPERQALLDKYKALTSEAPPAQVAA